MRDAAGTATASLVLVAQGRTMKLKSGMFVAAVAAIAIMGCGSSSPSSSQMVPASSGATLTAGAATLTIPPGALTQDTNVTLRETDPQHAGRATRVEVQPHAALAPGHVALLSVKLNDSNIRVAMHHGADDSLADVEVDDRNHHAFKTNMNTLGDIEVQVEHGTACATTCASGQECDDGICWDHDSAAHTCSSVCPVGDECDDGTCKTHDECAMEHHQNTGTCSPGCASGLTCHDGTCSAHE